MSIASQVTWALRGHAREQEGQEGPERESASGGGALTKKRCRRATQNPPRTKSSNKEKVFSGRLGGLEGGDGAGVGRLATPSQQAVHSFWAQGFLTQAGGLTFVGPAPTCWLHRLQ